MRLAGHVAGTAVTPPVTPGVQAGASDGRPVRHDQLVDLKVISLAEFRSRRQPPPADVISNDLFPSEPRPLSTRSVEHRARMLAHLAGTVREKRGVSGA